MSNNPSRKKVIYLLPSADSIEITMGLILLLWNLFQPQVSWAQQGNLSAYAPPNFYVVDNYVMRGAQPSQHNVRWLQQQGVNTIVKLDDENEEEFEWGTPIQWFHINKFGFNLSYGLIKSILHSLYRSMHFGKIYVHCERGADRTGLIVALYRVTRGWTIQQAWDEMNHPRFGHSALQVWIDYKFFEYADLLQKENFTADTATTFPKNETM